MSRSSSVSRRAIPDHSCRRRCSQHELDPSLARADSGSQAADSSATRRRQSFPSTHRSDRTHPRQSPPPPLTQGAATASSWWISCGRPSYPSRRRRLNRLSSPSHDTVEVPTTVRPSRMASVAGEADSNPLWFLAKLALRHTTPVPHPATYQPGVRPPSTPASDCRRCTCRRSRCSP